ncbi:MAG TPA: hypothetical protein VMW69_10520, partial [Spirochaetia bacterium]|nr:hypothetical protein [Spirochaetia bacterium]
MPGQKRNALLSIAAIIVITAGVGAALPRLELKPGLPLPSFESGHVSLVPSDGAPALGMGTSSFAWVFLLAIVAALLSILVVRLLKGIKWRTLLRELGSIFARVVLVAGILALIVQLLPKSQGVPSSTPLPEPKPLTMAPLGPTPSLLIWIVGIGLGALTLLLSLLAVFARRRTPVPVQWEDEVKSAR